jgi:hypothetical protein
MTLINNKWISNQDSAGFDSSNFAGSMKIGTDFTYTLDKWNLTLKTPTGDYKFSSTEEMESRFPKIMQDLVGRPLTALEKATMDQDTALMMKLTANADVKIDPMFDLAPALKGMDAFAPELEDKFKYVMGAVALNTKAYVRPQMKDTGEALITALAEPIGLDGWSKIKTQFDILQAQMGPGTESIFGDLAKKSTDAYKAKLLSGIADVGTFVKESMTSIGKEAQTAFSDGYISDSEKTMLLGLQPQLDLLKQECPAQFKAMGGDTIQAMIDALKAGDLPGAMAAIGKLAGEGFKENVLGGMSETVKGLKDIINDPSLLKNSIADPMRFYTGTIKPALEQMKKDGDAALASGQQSANQLYNEYVGQLYKVYNLVPGYVQKAIDLFATINPATGQGYISWQQMNSVIEQGNIQLDAANSKATQFSSTQQIGMGVTLNYDAACKSLSTTLAGHSAQYPELNSKLMGLNQKQQDGTITTEQYKAQVIDLATNALPKATSASDAYSKGMDAIRSSTDSAKGSVVSMVGALGSLITTLNSIPGGAAIPSNFGNFFGTNNASAPAQTQSSPVKSNASPATIVYGNPGPGGSSPVGDFLNSKGSSSAYSVPLVSSSSTSVSQAVPVVITNPSSSPIITKNYETSPYYSSQLWGGDIAQPTIQMNTGVLASPAKSPGVQVNEIGTPPINPFTDEQLLSVNKEALVQLGLQSNASLKMTGSLAVSTTATNTQTKATDNSGSSAKLAASANNGYYDSLIALSAQDGRNCDAISAFGVAQETSMGMFKTSSITFTDSLTPAQRALYNTSTSLVKLTADDGKYCDGISAFGLAQEGAMGKVSTSFIGTTAAYNAFHNAADGTTPAVTQLGSSTEKTGVTVGGLDKNVVQLGSSADHGTIAIGSLSRVITEIDPAIQALANTIVSNFKAITQEAIDGARAQADEYGQLTLGTDAVINSLVKLTAENGKFCEAISDFGLAQENTLGIFQQSYIGPTSGYDQFKQLDAGIAKAAGQTIKAGQVGGDYITQGAKEAKGIDIQGANQSTLIDVTGSIKAATTLNTSVAIGASALNRAASNIDASSARSAGVTSTSLASFLGTFNQVNQQTLNTSAQSSSIGVSGAAQQSNIGTQGATNVNSMNQGSASTINATNTSTWAGIGGSQVETWNNVGTQWTSTGTAKSTEWTGAGVQTKDTWVGGVNEGVKVFIQGAWVSANSMASAVGKSYNSATGTYQTNPNQAWGSGPSPGTFYNWGPGTGPGAVGVATPGEAQPSWMPGWTNQAKGGIVDSPTWTLYGEAGREAFIPLDDKAAGWDILRQILPEFGIQPFAAGGIVGRGSSNITINTTTQPSSSERETLVIVVDVSGKELTRQIMTGATKRLRLKIGTTK